MSYMDALNRVCKWRTVFAGWQLGTRPKGDPECDAVRDHREVTILMRVELNALVGLLLRKGLMTEAEWTAQLGEEADYLSEAYAGKFPGIRATNDGLSLDPVTMQAHGTMKGWRP